MMRNLKSLVEELTSLNDENLAQRVLDNNDVQWCLSELRDILSAKESTITLPCKVGDTVYVPYPALNSVEQFPIESIEIYKSGTVFCTDTCNVEFNASDFGKTVFTTREEAEKHIKN